MVENPYAEIIRILGRGPTKSRHLTREEAKFAFDGVLSGSMSDRQVGALLLLLRYRSENPEELAGIVEAMQDHVLVPQRQNSNITIDWPSYSSGKSRKLPWFLLSAKLLSEHGFKIFMHGFNSHLQNGLLTEECLAAVDDKPVTSLAEARQRLEQSNFVYLPLRSFAPKLLEMLQIRSELGVRSIVNTAVKLINPLLAKLIFLGIFHPPYIQLNLGAAEILSQTEIGILKGGGGEAERNIRKMIKLYHLRNSNIEESKWSAIAHDNWDMDYPVTVEYLQDIWQGKAINDFATAMICGTAAQALYLLGKASSVEDAENMASAMWEKHLNSY